MPHTPAQVHRFQEFSNYVRYIMDELRLKDWTMICHYSADVPQHEGKKLRDDHEWAAVAQCVPRRKWVEFTFHEDLPFYGHEHDPTDLRQTVIHEVLHCHFSPLWDEVRMGTLDAFSQDTYDQFCRTFEVWLEFAVDGIADAFNYQNIELFQPTPYKKPKKNKK